MLHCKLVMSKTGNTGRTRDVRDVGDGPSTVTVTAPLNARSLALSVLLGTHPPELPVRALVALADLFGIAPGTMRTALSRMVSTGELVGDGGRYELGPSLLARQTAQDAGRRAPEAAWDRQWHSVIVAADQRHVTERRRFRTGMANHRFGELRPDIWMRPSNLPTPPVEAGWIVTTGSLSGVPADELAARLWDLPAIAADARRLTGRLDDLRRSVDWSTVGSIPAIFVESASVVRFLRSEPLLPVELTPAGWPVDRLRQTYDEAETAFQALLQGFLRRADRG